MKALGSGEVVHCVRILATQVQRPEFESITFT